MLLRVPHAWDIWRYESIGELGENQENVRPWYFYLGVVQVALPWTPLFILGIVMALTRRREQLAAADPRSADDAARDSDAALTTTVLPYQPAPVRRTVPRRPRDRRPLFAVLWFAVMVLFFSFVKQKKNAYLVPVMPAESLIITQGLMAVIVAGRRARFRGVRGALAAVQSLTGVGAAAALAWLVLRATRGALVDGTRVNLPTASLAIAIGVLALTCVPIWLMLHGRPRTWAIAQGVAYGVLVATLYGLYLEPLDNGRSAKGVCREVQGLLREGGRTVQTDHLPEEAGVYLPLNPESLGAGPFASKVLLLRDDAWAVKQRRLHRPSQDYVPGASMVNGRIAAFRRIPLKCAPGDARWKLYEITVDRSALVSAQP